MGGCTNQELGQLLHDYELDMLSPEDRHRFELHLYDCDHCLALVREFADVSKIILHDPEARAIIEGIADETSDDSVRRARKEPFRFTNLLIAAAIVAVLVIPTYLIWLQPENAAVTQTIELLPIRTGGNNVIYLEKGGSTEISFFVAESFTGEARLIISSVEGDTVVNKPGFSDFTEKGMGSITVPVSIFSEGNYIMAISPGPETGIAERIYLFRVK